MMRLIVIRPQPGCDATLTVARDLRLDAYGFPLFEVAPVAWEAPDPAEVDALLIGSANAVRHAGGQLQLYAGKPAYAVGRATAEVAQQAGLAIAMVGNGGLQAVLNRIEIGGISVRDVQALVLPDKALSGTLIGMTFLSRLSSFRVEDGALHLVR